MMTIASVRVRPADPDSEKPNQFDLEKAAELLQNSGFKVHKVGRFGVSIEGEEENFREQLGVDIPSDKGGVATAVPRDPALADMVDTVEVAPPPSYY
ncbi:hypothetical protein [Methylobacterium isbiliense]|uniref:hypothetical protein n=1 Tax=Methylobacterium isbiliense TaxID=315478 RepID=UPI001EE1F6F8|nr:hypothetical protein [Methylobacterium isbiliense]MDN3626965.1 hypothetical protein [Methylobacterium isbiliense]